MKKIAFIFAALCVVFFSCNNSSDAPLPPSVVPVKKASEWLFLFYFDGDDTSINDDWTGFSIDWGQVIKAWWDYSKSGN